MKKAVWNKIIQLKQLVKNIKTPIRFCAFSLKETRCYFNDPPYNAQIPFVWVVFEEELPEGIKTADLVYKVQNLVVFSCVQKGTFSKKLRKLFSYYLPFCFLDQHARRIGRAIGISHFAQTLDGKIATVDGDSKWIGSEENLIHAHRMRAITDAILIGYNTLICDQPQLTVRRVNGPNPVRVVVGSKIDACNSLLEASNEDQIILIHKKKTSLNGGTVKQLILPCENRYFSCEDILKGLYQMGISSVYVEGGPKTTSLFLQEAVLDIIQLHIEPIIFGSGKSGFELDPIHQVEQAICFSSYYFQKISDTVMFTGQPDYGNEE